MELLGKAIRDPDERVRYGAADALRCHGKAGINILIDALEDPRPEVRRSAAEPLGQYGRLRARLALLSLMRSDDPVVRRAAMKELGLGR